jgi:hypothetical protein
VNAALVDEDEAVSREMIERFAGWVQNLKLLSKFLVLTAMQDTHQQSARTPQDVGEGYMEENSGERRRQDQDSRNLQAN